MRPYRVVGVVATAVDLAPACGEGAFASAAVADGGVGDAFAGGGRACSGRRASETVGPSSSPDSNNAPTRVCLDGPVLADITLATVGELRIRPGDRLGAALKATEINTYPD
ncbi:hypothetical protein [Nocardia xishanensis]|uniref:hypothetical protein n=1 Tax=Nocardia xishanensis TaxID=238964 RepID=UPI003417D35A